MSSQFCVLIKRLLEYSVVSSVPYCGSVPSCAPSLFCWRQWRGQPDILDLVLPCQYFCACLFTVKIIIDLHSKSEWWKKRDKW